MQATCSRCDHEADVPKINGVQPDLPAAWSTVQMKTVGDRVLTLTLCSWCSQMVRMLLEHDDHVTVTRKRLDHLLAIEDAANAQHAEAVRSGADS